MALYRFRGHASGLDLDATVQRFPQLAGRADAADALRRALDRWAEDLRAQVVGGLDQLITEWAEEARAARRTKLRRAHSQRLASLPLRIEALLPFVPDAPAIVGRVVPRGLVARLTWRQPEAAVTRRDLDGLQRALVRRLDPALARHVARDASLAEILPVALGLLGSGGPAARSDS